jgi:YihY family inner membrane protein
MNRLESATRRADAFQQRHHASGLVVGVLKKYGDDNAGALTVQLTYAMFTTIFPLLLVLVTVLAIVLADHPGARNAVLNSTFGQFPVVGKDLAGNIHVLKRGSTLGLAVGLLGLVYGSTGLAGAGLAAMEQVWNVPWSVRPNFVKRMVRSLLFIALLGVGVTVTTFLSGFGTFGRHNFWLGIVSEALAVLVNVGLYLGAFRVLTPKPVGTRDLVPGAVVGGVAWTVLQAFGGYFVGHYLKGDSATYGTFGTVLGLLAWLYLGARVTMYSAELNAVLARHLWPRAMVQPPLTKADQESIAGLAVQGQRRPEQLVVTEVRGRPMTEDEYLQAGEQVDPDCIGTRRVAEARTGARPAPGDD